MKKRIISIFMCLCLLLSVASVTAFAEGDEDSIIILFENDVHCAIEGYSKLKAYKDELQKTNAYVGVVSVGDYVQGSSLGAISQGDYMVETMNMVGYDALTLGNHEFDYKLSRLSELTALMNTKPVCANFQKVGENTPVFDPYTIVSYGDVDIAYIGVTTPDTLTSSAPSQFKDENGNYIYTFSGDNLYSTVQKYIDEAKSKGADYVIALTHLGTENVYEQWSAPTLVKNTEGLDVVLDGHSHSVVPGMKTSDKNGDEVLIASTGTKFENVGKLTIDEGSFSTELIPTDTLTDTDPEIDAYIERVNLEYAELGERLIGKSEVHLITHDAAGNRLIRNTETNLGDFCADAFRVVMGADVGVMNGGGIRTDLKAGDVTFNDILSVYPFNNAVCVSEVTGQQIADLLEHCLNLYPVESGAFQHVSGLSFDLKAYLPTPVVLDENMAFVRVEGERRVSNIKVLNSESGEYEPIDLNKIYTIASHSYLLVDHGEGTTMLDGSKVISNTGMLDVELLEEYITEYLGGVIGEEYAASQGRINVISEAPTEPAVPETTVAEEETSAPLSTDPQSTEDKTPQGKPDAPNTGEKAVTYVTLGASVLLFVLCVTLVLRKKENI